MAASTENVVTITNGLATLTDICKLFDLTDKTVRKKLLTVEPAMKRGNAVHYRLEQVLPYLVKPANVGDYIRSMSFAELPKDLTKEYWAGQRSKQIFEKEAGNLWSTQQVVERVGDAFKTIAMRVRLMPDSVSRVSTLTEPQREELERLVDETLKGIAVELKAKFQTKPVVVEPAQLPAPETADEEEEDDEL